MNPSSLAEYDPVSTYDSEGLEVSDWLTSIVNGSYKTMLFLIPLRLGLSAVCRFPLCRNVRVGDIVDVKIRRNPTAAASDRSKHVVVDLRKSSSEFKVRVDKSGRGEQDVAMVEDVAIPYTLSQRKNTMLLKNQDFGIIVDLYNIVPKHVLVNRTPITIEFKATVSPVNTALSIFVVCSVLDCGAPHKNEVNNVPNLEKDSASPVDVYATPLATPSPMDELYVNKSRCVSPASTYSSAVADIPHSPPTEEEEKGRNKYEGKSELEMLEVLLGNPKVVKVLKESDMSAYIQVNNLVFQE